MKNVKKVFEFNEKIIGLKPINFMTKDRINWFKTVVNEELNEFIEANEKASKIDMLDALIDLLYFVMGRLYECSFTPEQFDAAFNAIHECNMNKKKGNKGRDSNDDAIKETTWIGPEENIKKILEDDNLKCIESGSDKYMSIDEVNFLSKIPTPFKEATAIMLKKSEDYNNGDKYPNSRNGYFPFGLISYAQMLHIKTQRMNSLALQNKIPNNESIRDTLLDLINYACFAIEAIDKGEI